MLCRGDELTPLLLLVLLLPLLLRTDRPGLLLPLLLVRTLEEEVEVAVAALEVVVVVVKGIHVHSGAGAAP